MNQSKKILAALVAIPASVVVAGEVSAAEDTLSFEIKNDFTATGSTSVQALDYSNLHEGLSAEVLNKMANFNTGKFSYELDLNQKTNTNQTNLQYAKTEVEKIFDYLKGNLNEETTITIDGVAKNLDNTLLYGFLNNAKVTATEIKINNDTKVKLEFAFTYIAEATYTTTRENIYMAIFGSNSTLNTHDVTNIKKVHDYIIKRANVDRSKNTYINLSVQNGGLSPHVYSLWTYELLKKAGYPVRYVYGMSEGSVHSWNLVEVNNNWYSLDVSKDDSQTGDNSFIQYRYFLTNTNHASSEIYFGNKDQVTLGSINAYANIINPIDKNNIFYYIDRTDGLLKSFAYTIANASPTSVTNDKAVVNSLWNNGDSLFFINDSKAKYLYEFNIASPGTAPKEVIKEQINSYQISGTNLIYRAIGDTADKTISLIGGIDNGMAKYVADSITAINLENDVASLTESAKQAYIKKVVEAQKLYAVLTVSQEQIAVNLLKYTETDANNNTIELNRLEELEKSLNALTTDQDVKDLIVAIKAIDISKPTFIDDVTAANDKLNRLTASKQSLVYNVGILNSASDQILYKDQVEAEISEFIVTNGNESVRDRDFYDKVSQLVTKYDNLHPSLKVVTFNVTYQALKTLGNNSSLSGAIQEIQDILSTLNENATNYLTKAKELKDKYKVLTESQKSLLANDKDKIEQHIAKFEVMTADVEKFKGYLSYIGQIDNNVVPPKPEKLESTFINMIKQAKSLIDKGLKPSQWAAIESEASLSKATIIERVTVFLDRVKLLEDGLLNEVATAKTKIVALDNTIKLNLNNYTDPQDFIDEVDKTLGELLTIAGNTSNLSVLLALLGDVYLDEYNNLITYEEIKNNLSNTTTVLTEYETKTTTLLAPDASGQITATEAQINGLVTEISKLHSVYKHFLKEELENLNRAKSGLEDGRYTELANTFITDITRLLLNPDSVKYEDLTPHWNHYLAKANESQTFKALVENHIKFEEFKALWEIREAEHQSDEALAIKISELELEITALSNNATLAEIEALQEKYADIIPAHKDKVSNYSRLETLLANATEKDKDATDREAAERIIEKISLLSDESTKQELEAIRQEYEALSDEAKVFITQRHLNALVYFEKRMEALIEVAKKEAQVVIDRINRITSSYTEAEVKRIQVAYDALSSLAKSYVPDAVYQKLRAALGSIDYENTVVKQAKLDANAFDLYMNEVDRYSTTQEIAKARATYNRLSYEAKRHVTTYEKLVRLETMWRDPEYLELVFTYYPEYVNAVKPGAIVIEKPTYDPLYIPDDSTRTSSPSSVATSIPNTATWSQYETMTYQNGRYTTQITASQAKNVADRNMRLKAGEIEIVIPTAELQSSTATVGVSVNMTNNQLNIQFTEGNNAKIFSSTVEIHVPVSALKANTSQIIERVTSSGSSPASFKVDGSNFVIRTNTSGTFKATTSTVHYTDIPNNTQGHAIRELANRGITFNTTNRLVQSYKQVNKLDVSMMLASALDLSSDVKSKYLDIENEQNLKRVQGLLEAGIMTGATSNRFAPNAGVTKQEAAIILANLYRYLNQDLSKAYNELKSNYRDVANLSLEARQSIAILELFGVVDGVGSFNPTQTLSRGEFAELLYDALIAINYL